MESVAKPEFELTPVLLQSVWAPTSLRDMGAWHLSSQSQFFHLQNRPARPQTHPEVPLRHLGEDAAQGSVVRAELHLARAVEEEVVVAQGVELGTQPVQVGLQVLHAVEQAAVGAQLQRVHHVAQTHQLAHVHGALVRQPLVGWVQVHHRHAPAQRAQELAHAQTVCGLPRARRTDHRLPKRRGRSGCRHGRPAHGSVVSKWARQGRREPHRRRALRATTGFPQRALLPALEAMPGVRLRKRKEPASCEGIRWPGTDRTCTRLPDDVRKTRPGEEVPPSR